MLKEEQQFYESLGQLIRRERTKAGYTLEKAAKSVGLRNGLTLQRYEKGSRATGAHILVKLGQLFTGDPGYFTSQLGKLEVQSEILPAISYNNIIHESPYFHLEKIVFELIENEANLINAILAKISEIAKIAVIAAFKYDWIKDELLKFDEYIDEQFRSKSEPLNEVYYPSRNLFITERAWNSKEPYDRFIADYPRRRRVEPTQVQQDSYDRHKKLLSTVLSTMYGELRTPDLTYLIRCFNRSECPDLLLDLTQYNLLQELCKFVSKRIEVATTKFRMEEQHKLHKLAKNPTLTMEDKLNIIRTRLEKEDMPDFFVLLDRTMAKQFTETRMLPRCQKAFEKITAKLLNNDEFFKRVEAQEPFVQGVAQLGLKLCKYSDLLVFPFSLEETPDIDIGKSGALVFPLERTGPFSSPISITRLRDVIPNKLVVLNTYAALLGSLIKNDSSKWEYAGILPSHR